MIDMDVHVQYHPIQTIRRPVATMKRARSPDSTSERPLKRLSLAISSPNTLSNPEDGRYVSRSLNNSRHTSEDWVQQTGDLTIHSPVYTEPLSHASSGDADPIFDVDMTMEGDVTQTVQNTQTLFQTQSVFFPEQPVRPVLNTALSTNGITVSCATKIQPYAPEINVVPPTPTSYSGNPLLTPTPSPMTISPTSSYLQVGSPKRQRFAMGPRADCEKCRLRVKGHSVHLD